MIGRVRISLAIVLACSACGTVAPGDGGPGACDDGRVEVGSGGSRLRALPETGGELPIVLGAQGGIHVVVGFWLRELPLDVTARYWLEDPASGELVGTETVLVLGPSFFAPDGARYVRHPDLLVLNNEAPDVAAFAGRTVELHVSATSGSAGSCDARTAVLAAP
jgi:hypothetical protein